MMDQFQVHPQSQIFIGTDLLHKSDAQQTRDFTMIPCDGTAAALHRLLNAINAQAPFCLHGQSAPAHLTAPDAHFVTLTGGTSGQPKAVLRSQTSWIKSFQVNAHTFGITHNSAVAVLGRLDHSLALYGVLEALHLGTTLSVLADQTAPAQRAALATTHTDLIYATPSQLRKLTLKSASATLPNVRYILCGGGALDAATRKAAHQLCPNAAIRVFYGAAETSFITLADQDTPQESVGKPYPGVTIAIQDLNHAAAAAGEIWIKSPYVFDRYLSGESESTRWDNGYVSIGEVGHLDALGNLTILGRRTRMFQIADQMFQPEQIEAALGGLAPGRSVVVLPVADPLREHRIAIIFEGAPDDRLAKEAAHLCQNRFSPLARPKHVLFCDYIQRRSSGKVDLAALNLWMDDQI